MRIRLKGVAQFIVKIILSAKKARIKNPVDFVIIQKLKVHSSIINLV